MNGRERIAAAVTGGVGAALAARALRGRGYDFADKVVVITGGSRGLGLALARELADEGARLALLARDAAELDRAAEDLAARGAAPLTLPCDVRDREDVDRAVARVVERYGRLDVLINVAGVIQVGPVQHMTLDDFADAMAVHFWGPLYATLAAAPQLRRQGGGRVVNIASIGGLVAVPHLLPYAASKFALVGLSDGLRAELARDGIVVTTVCPGLMRTGSPPNALFKGRHRAEYTWFALGDALPVLSIDARRAARQILGACRRGDPSLTITLPARALAAANALAPNLMGEAMKLVTRLLPDPTGPEGEVARPGRESTSPLAPSPLTALSDRAAARNNELPEAAPASDIPRSGVETGVSTWT